MKNLFKKQLFSIRKFSVGVASVLIGASMLNVAQPIVKTEAQAKENIKVEATKDVKITLKEENGGAKVNIQATKDLKNAEVKVTLDGKIVATYRVANLKAGESAEKEVTKEQLDKVKEELRRVEERRQQRIAQRQGMSQGTTQGINGQTNKTVQEQKTLPKTAVVRKNVSEEIKIEGHTLAAIVSYDVEENDEVKPAEKPTPEVVPTQPGEGTKPTTPEVIPPKPETGDAKPSDKPGAGNEVKPEKPEVKPSTPEVVPPKVEENTKPKEEQPAPKEETPAPEVKPSTPEVVPPKVEEKPKEEQPAPKEETPAPEVKPSTPEVVPPKAEENTKPKEDEQPAPKEETPAPEVKPSTPEVVPPKAEENTKPKEDVQPVPKEETPAPEVKPSTPEVVPPKVEEKPKEEQPAPKEETPTPEVKPSTPEVVPPKVEENTKPKEEQPAPKEETPAPETSPKDENKPTEVEKPKEETRKKVSVEPVFVINGQVPVLDSLTFKFTNDKEPTESVEKTTEQAMLAGEELYLGEEYTLSLKDNNRYTFEPRKVKALEKDGFVVLHDAVTNKAIETLSVKEVENIGDDEDDEDIVTLDGITAKVVDKDNKPIANAPFRLFEYDNKIPNIVKELKTNEKGEITLRNSELKPNKKYDLRIEKRDVPFLRENVVFQTDEDADITTIDNQVVTDDTTGVIEFKEEKTTNENIKVAHAHFKVVDEQGKPVKDVELSASGIRTKITTLKNSRSDENGIVTLDLESKVNGVDYIVNVSKNDQFNWQFSPDAVSLFVSEEGTISYRDKEGKYKLEEYNGEEIPVFVVKKIDVNHLKPDLEAKIKEAEEVLKTKDSKELRDIVNSAKEELAKKETLPIYIGGYLNDLTKQLEKINPKEEHKPEKPTAKKGAISEIIITKNQVPALEPVTFEFVNKSDDKDHFEKSSANGILTDVEVSIGATYTIRVKNNESYTYEQDVVIRDEDGEAVAFAVDSDEPVVQINLVSKKVEKPMETRKKGTLEFIAVSDENGPISTVSIKFENLKHEENTFIVKPNDGIIKNTELYLDEEYKVSLVDDGKHSFEPVSIVVKDEDGEISSFYKETGEYFDTIDLKNKKVEEESEDEEEYAYRDSITIRALENGKGLANTDFDLYRWEGKIPNKLRTLRTNDKGELTVQVLNGLPVDSTYQLISKKNPAKYVTFYSDDEGYLWNINQKELDKNTPKIIDINL